MDPQVSLSSMALTACTSWNRQTCRLGRKVDTRDAVVWKENTPHFLRYVRLPNSPLPPCLAEQASGAGMPPEEGGYLPKAKRTLGGIPRA